MNYKNEVFKDGICMSACYNKSSYNGVSDQDVSSNEENKYEVAWFIWVYRMFWKSYLIFLIN